MRILTLLVGLALAACAQQPRIPVLIVDGANNHDWRALSEYLQSILAATGKFRVDVSTSPPPAASADAWEHWRPDFSRYKVVVNNFIPPNDRFVGQFR